MATAGVRVGDLASASLAARAAVQHYRPIVEDGLYPLYARYLTEIAAVLPAEDVAPFIAAMDPEVVAVGALPPSGDPPARFLALFADLLQVASGGRLPLDRLCAHEAAHLLLVDLSHRSGDDPALDSALFALGHEAACDAERLAGEAASHPDPFTRVRLRHALLRLANTERSLLGRSPDAARRLLAEFPLAQIARMPRGPRLETLQALAEAVFGLPGPIRNDLYPRVIAATRGTGGPDQAVLRRQTATMAAITAAFTDASWQASEDALALLAWFLADDAVLGEGVPTEAARGLCRLLGGLGGLAVAGLVQLFNWCKVEAPGAQAAVLAAWARAAGCSPFDLAPEWGGDPVRAWSVVKEADGQRRSEWAARALAQPAWDIRAVALDSDREDAQRALAELLVLYPEPLGDAGLAEAIAGYVQEPARGALVRSQGPFARTLGLLGLTPPPYALAVLFDARVCAPGYGSAEHDRALRQIVAWSLQDGPNAALRLAAGFGSRNDASWLLGPLLAEGAAEQLDPALVDRLSLHPFLYGAYLLETRCVS